MKASKKIKKVSIEKILLACLLYFFCVQTYSQDVETQIVRGTVIDAESQYPLLGATVQLIGDSSVKTIATVTDMDGRFTLEKVPIGRQNFVCKYLGYKDRIINDFLVVKGKEGVLNIHIEESVGVLDEIVLFNRKKGEVINETVTVSAITLETDEIIRFSGTLGDVSRMAQNFAGVSGASDDRNDIIVRGNSPSSVLWRMEGVDIPSPNHYATLGTTGGPISMLNINNLKTSDFLSGAFPAEYGNVTGAVFDLKLRNGNSESYEFLGQIAFNGFELGVEGPMKFVGNNSSFLVNYRYSTLGLLSEVGINLDLGTGGAIPKFQDINFKLNIPTEKAGRFSVWGLGGISDIRFSADNNNNLFSANNENLISSTTTGILGINHKYFFNSKTSSTVSIAYSSSKNRNTREGIIPSNSEQFQKIFDGNSRQNKTTINWTINSKLNSKHLIRAGANLDLFNIKILDSLFVVDNKSWFNQGDFEGSTSLYRFFGQWQYKFNDKLKFNSGINALYLGLNKSFALEPRIGITYAVNEKNKFAIAYGRHSQMQPLPIYFSLQRDAADEQNTLNRELDFIKSNHYVFSYTHYFKNKLKIKSELYYQTLSSVAVDPTEGYFSVLNVGADFVFPKNTGLLNDGTGKNYGVELTLQQNLNKGLYYILTSSIFQSKYSGSDKIERNTYYNSNYVINALFGKEIQVNNNLFLMFDAKFTYAGGRRYNPIDLEASIKNGEETLDYTNAFESQYDPYIRPDFKIGLKLNYKNTTHTWSVDLQNFIGRKNIFTQIYNNDTQSVKTLYQRGFFPNVRYQIVF